MITSVIPSSSSPQSTEPETNLIPNSKSEVCKKTSLRQKFVQIVVPQIPKFEIPNDTEHVIFGIPGFLCTNAALKPGIDDLNQDGIVYIDWGEALDIGFTHRIMKHVDDSVKAIAQQFGGQISVHGNSLGGFFAYFAANSNPQEIKRLILTASPHLLTLDSKSLSEHTNIAPFIGLMNSTALSRFMRKDIISQWEQFRSGKMSDEIKAYWNPIDELEKLIFTASKDTTVRGRMCLSSQTNEFLEKLILNPEQPSPIRPENRPNVREFVVAGDHSDVFRGATKTIKFLASKEIQTELPADIAAELLPIEAVEELVHRSTQNVVWDFTRSSLPSVNLGQALHSTLNAPVSLLKRIIPRIPGPEAGLEFERPAISALAAG